jgi:hypothetical protein
VTGTRTLTRAWTLQKFMQMGLILHGNLF